MNLARQLEEAAKPTHTKSPQKALDAFMAEYGSKTHDNPFGGGERLVGFRRPGVKIPKGAKFAPPNSVDWVTLKLRPWEGHIHIEWMQVPPDSAGRGAATKALDILSSMADKHRVQMGLNAKPTGLPKIPKGKLKALYRKFGFVSVGGDRMLRDPKGGAATVA